MEKQLQIKLSQFMLEYERRCTERDFADQAIKQNLMLELLNKNIQSSQSQVLQKSNPSKLENKKTNKVYQNEHKGISAENYEEFAESNNLQSVITKPILANSAVSNTGISNSTVSNASKVQRLKHSVVDSTQENRNKIAVNVSSSQVQKRAQLHSESDEEEHRSKYIENQKSDNLSKRTIKYGESQVQRSEAQSSITDRNHVELEIEGIGESNLAVSGHQESMIIPKKKWNKPGQSSERDERQLQLASNEEQNKNVEEKEQIANLSEYPTFQKAPSFQFITNVSDLRSPQQTEKVAVNEGQNQHLEEENQQAEQVEMPPRSYAFEINMDKSNVPNSEDIEELRKRKIIEMERKRQERLQKSRNKNSSEVTNRAQQRPKSRYGAVQSTKNARKDNPSRENRDSLNKTYHEKPMTPTSAKNKKAENHSNRPSNMKKQLVAENFHDNGKESALQDNRTVISKYYEEGREKAVESNRVSPFMKTANTEKRPPSHKNKKEQTNIFLPESTGTFQRDKSNQKLHIPPTDPKIQPKNTRNSFQKQSNKRLMTNAITYVCLPGELNRKQRERLLDVFDKYENEFYVFLFKEYSRKVIKGIYLMDATQSVLMKIFGDKAPAQIMAENVHEFYRFDSGSREFKKMEGCKSFSFSVHAIDLK